MLRNIYNDKQSSFIKLQEKSNSFSLLQQNLKILAMEIYKVRNDLSSSLMRNILELSIKIYILSKVFNFYTKSGFCVSVYYVSHFEEQKYGIWYQTNLKA